MSVTDEVTNKHRAQSRRMKNTSDANDGNGKLGNTEASPCRMLFLKLHHVILWQWCNMLSSLIYLNFFHRLAYLKSKMLLKCCVTCFICREVQTCEQCFATKIQVLGRAMLCHWVSGSRHLTDKAEGTMILPNTRNYSPNDTASHPRRLESSVALLWQSQMLHCHSYVRKKQRQL